MWLRESLRQKDASRVFYWQDYVLFFLHLPTLSIEKFNARLIKKIIWISFYYNIMCQLYKDDDLLMLNKTLNLKTAILGESKMGETFFSAIRKKYIDMNVLGVYHAASCV